MQSVVLCGVLCGDYLPISHKAWFYVVFMWVAKLAKWTSWKSEYDSLSHNWEATLASSSIRLGKSSIGPDVLKLLDGVARGKSIPKDHLVLFLAMFSKNVGSYRVKKW